MTAYFRFVLRHRLAVILGCLALTALSGYALSDAVLATSVRKMFFGDRPEYADYIRRMRRFANDEVFVIAYGDPQPLSRASLARLERAIARVERLPDVARTDSLLSAQRIWAEGDTLRVERYGKLARQRPQDAAALLAALRKDALVSGLLISEDGRHSVVIVELKVDPDRRAERTPELVRDVLQAFVAAGFAAENLHRGGIPALLAAMIDHAVRNLRVLFPATALTLLLVVLALFRRLGPVTLVMTVSGLSVVFTMAFARLLDREFGIFMTVVPAVILIVAFSDVIHLWSAYQVELDRGKTRDEAILASATDVGRACVLTSATTFFGFVCLSAIPTPIFRILGVVLGFGVAAALLLAMTLVPIALSFSPAPPARAPAAASPTSAPRQTWMRWLLAAMARLATARPWLVIGVFAALLALCGVGLLGLHIETEMAKRLDEQASFSRDKRYIDEHFAGTNMLEVFVDAARDEALLDQRIFRRVAALQARLAALPEADRVVSLVTLIEIMHRALGGKGRLPDHPAAIAQYLLLFEMSGGEDLERLVDFKRRSARLAVRLREYGIRATHDVGRAAERIGGELLAKDAQVKGSGLGYMMGWWLGSIVEGQQLGLLLSFVLIAVLMVIGMRSLRVGVLSMIPNLLPLLALGAYLGFTRERTDSDTLVVAIMAIGIGVDDTIHFLMRLRIESERTADRVTAIREAFFFSGRAIVLTTLVLVLGFLPLATAEYYSVKMLGTLLPAVLVVALLADLLLVPAMARVGLLAFRR